MSVVAQSGSVMEAAKLLGISSPAVSHHLKELERETGLSLFIRQHRKIIPTSEALSISKSVDDLMSGLEQAVNFAHEGRSHFKGKIRFGCPVVWGGEMLPKILKTFQQEFPNVVLEVQFSLPEELLKAISNDKLDLCIVDAGDAYRKFFPLIFEDFIVEKQILVGSEKFKHMNTSSYESICQLPFISHVVDGLELKFWFKKHFSKVPRELDVRFVCGDTRFLLNGAREGLGFSLLPEYLVQNSLKSGSLFKIKTQRSSYENRMMIARLPQKKPMPIQKAFLQHLKKNNLLF